MSQWEGERGSGRGVYRETNGYFISEKEREREGGKNKWDRRDTINFPSGASRLFISNEAVLFVSARFQPQPPSHLIIELSNISPPIAHFDSTE